jgi:hypothetical protein
MMICSIGLDPRLGQVRLHPAALGDRGVAFLAAGQRLEAGHFLADLLAELLGLRVEVDVQLAHPRSGGQVDHPLRVVRRLAEAGHQHERAPVVHVGVVFPGEADTAVHLDAVLRAVLCCGRRQRPRHRRGELESGFFRRVFARLVDGTGGIPHCCGGSLGDGDHLCALVLDGLELTDRPAELLADLGVCRCGVGGPSGEPDAFGGQQRRHECAGKAPAQVAEHPIIADLDGIGTHVGDGPEGIDALDGFDLQLVGVEDHPLLAAIDRHRKHEHRGLRGRGHRPHLAPDHQAVTLPGRRQPRVDRVRGDHLSGGQLGEHLRLRVVRRYQRAGDGRGDERARHRAVAELGDDDRKLEDAESLSADRFGEVHPLQTLFGRGLPVGRRVRDRCLEGLVQNVGRRNTRHQGPNRIGQVVVLR